MVNPLKALRSTIPFILSKNFSKNDIIFILTALFGWVPVIDKKIAPPGGGDIVKNGKKEKEPRLFCTLV